MHAVRLTSLQKWTSVNLGQVLARFRLPAHLGGNANVFTYVSIANDTGYNVQTVFTTDLANPNTYRGNLPAIYVNAAGGVVLRQRTSLEVQLLKQMVQQCHLGSRKWV